MSADYIILAVVAALGISGGMFLRSQAKKYRARHHHSNDKRPPHQPTH